MAKFEQKTGSGFGTDRASPPVASLEDEEHPSRPYNRCFYRGTIVPPGKWLTIPCTIVGLSEGGGRLLLGDESAVLPPFFDLRWNDRDSVRRCKLVGRRNRDVEVRWEEFEADE